MQGRGCLRWEARWEEVSAAAVSAVGSIGACGILGARASIVAEAIIVVACAGLLTHKRRLR